MRVKASAESDVFNEDRELLGGITYELFTGKDAFEEENIQKYLEENIDEKDIKELENKL